MGHRIFCYGDSLTAGTGSFSSERHPYAPHLEATLNNSKKRVKNPVDVQHVGLDGWTSAQLLKYADSNDIGLRAILRRMQQDKRTPLSLVIILAGTNDLAFTSEAAHIVEPIIKLHNLCYEEAVPHSIVIGIPPSGYQAFSKTAANLAREVNQALEEFCASERNATFMSFPFEYKQGGELWASDGLHFSEKGYKTLAENLAPLAEEILTQEDA